MVGFYGFSSSDIFVNYGSWLIVHLAVIFSFCWAHLGGWIYNHNILLVVKNKKC